MGPVRRAEELGATKGQNKRAEGYVEAGTWAPKLKGLVSHTKGFSDPVRMALWPLPRLLGTHSPHSQVLP